MDQVPHIHFSQEEFEQRKARVLQELEASRLDGLLMFRQESMYWLTGYDTFGYVFFQCLYLAADGDLKLLTRMPDLRQAKFTSIVPDVRIWKDAEHANPARDLMNMLEQCGCRGKRLGVEWESYGLTARNGRLLDETLKEFCRLEDASFLISRLRLTKSPQELEYVRKAGELADLALDEIHRTTAPGAWEGDILAALQAVIFRNDGDYPGNENIIGSGPGAFMGRYFTGRRHLGQNDELLVEFAGVYRRYHAALMRVIRVGKPIPKQLDLYQLGLDALQACQEACSVGRPIGDIYLAFERTVRRSRYEFGGQRDLGRPFSIGYSLGATFAPNWMDYPLLYRDNPLPIEENMVFFMHMTLRDDERGFNAVPGESVIVTKNGVERLSKRSLEFVVKS
jgi:Xaa-Pro dipeptidase